MPLLIPLINLTMVAKGVLPLHAAAFVYHGVGRSGDRLVEGRQDRGGCWPSWRTARTTWATRWVYLPADDSRCPGHSGADSACGTGTCGSFRELRERLGRSDRLRLAALRGMAALHRARARSGAGAPWRVSWSDSGFADLDPRAIFPAERCALAGRFDRLFWMVTHDAPTIDVMPVSAEESRAADAAFAAL
ncbi:MAG: hypothetical protein KatS3mg051_1629 [Anaerolineae bacterium]|nr:MAG: hypothetical protein KatS3mg051_1629 [Anaerolineae bacterium]